MALYSYHSDEELLQLMQGEEAAFTELYNRYWKKLLTRAYMQLRSREEAEELLHDVFVKLWNRRETIQLRHSFHTYIAAVLKYEILQKLADRRKERMKTGTAGHPIPLTDDSTQQRLDFLDLRNQLEASVRQLPNQCQLVFRLSREKGLAEKEIAQKLQLSPKTVQNHLHRALKALKDFLHHPRLFLL